MQRCSLVLAIAASAAVVSVGGTAAAQSVTTGAIQGRVVERATQEPMAGVTVIVTSPALIEPQTAFTDEDGRYKITELPPGTYVATFYAEDSELRRTGITVSANQVTPVFQRIKRGEVVEIDAPPPPIDVTTTNRGGKLDRKFLEAIPLPSRTADGAAGAQPGAHNDGVGISFSGSTSLENRYLVDGIDITGLTFGDVGTPILNEFVEEVEVLTGGYNAEWGRAIGGIVNIVTKRGGNHVRGSVFGTLRPSFLAAKGDAAPVNASSIDVTSDRAYSADFGVELGGPIVRDRVWFYAGVAPQLARTDFTRTTKRQTDCRKLLPSGTLSHCDARSAAEGGFADGAPDLDPATGFVLTEELDREVRTSTSRSLTAIGKLDVALTPKQQGRVSAIVVPSRSASPALLGLPTTGRRSTGMTIDTAARWAAKLDDDRTELEALVAWHGATFDSGAADRALDRTPAQTLFGGDLGRWSALGGESAPTTRGCTDGGPGDPFPGITNCPMAGYGIGGPGALAHDREDRYAVRLSALRRARLAGTHELKAGIDVEDDRKVTARQLSGGAAIENSGSIVDVTRWVRLGAPDATDPELDRTCSTPDADGTTGAATKSFRCAYVGARAGDPHAWVRGRTRHRAAYLRDSWQPRANLTLNAGVRYEEQEMFYASNLRGTTDPLTGTRYGETAMHLRGNVAPRLGAIWDPSELGRSKLFVAWGRFFEAIPMDINDRSFGGEVSYRQTFGAGSAPFPCGPPDARLGIANGAGCLTPSGAPSAEQLIGSSGVLVAPGIRAQYLDELLAGGEYVLGDDVKLGVTLQHRRLGRVIEDVSTDGAATYIIANPGEWSTDEERALAERIARTADPVARDRLAHQLAMFRGIRRFDRPQRDYVALEVSLARRFTRGLFVQAAYTYSRTEGNFPGSVSYDNGQIDPNISSQYDLIELLANRRGPLPQDRPHSLKLDSYYRFDLGVDDALTIGARLRAVSGTPINALGGHALYGPDESFLLPRGQLGRTPMMHGADLHVAYARKLPRGMAAEVFVDVFNVYDHQGTFAVDATYAPRFRRDGSESNANPISGGTYEDLIWAKAIDGGTETARPVARNPNFGKTVSRYAPASAQVGFRLTF